MRAEFSEEKMPRAQGGRELGRGGSRAKDSSQKVYDILNEIKLQTQKRKL